MNLISLAVGFAAGAIVAWNTPQPEWVKDACAKAKDAIASIKGKLK